MGYPANVATVTVTGTWVYSDGGSTTPTGTVTFQPNTVLQDAGTSQIIDVKPLVATLDGSGHISVTLMNTSDVDLAPSGWAYTVTEHVAGNQRQYDVFITGTSVDLSTLAPISSTPQFGYVLTAAVGAPNGVATLDGTGNVPVGQLGNVPGAGTSLLKANNLSDLTSAPTARTNLGLGTAATQNTGAFDAAGAAAAAQAASQPLDADLTAVAALSATAGILARTGANAFAVRTLTTTDASITITGGDGASANPTFGTSLSAILGVSTSAGSHKITSVTDPAAAQDAATKAYVDTGSFGTPVAVNTAGGSFGTNVTAGTPSPTAQNGPGLRTYLAGGLFLAASTTFAANSVLATLPTAQRPAAIGRWAIRTIGSSTQSLIAVDTDGTIKNLSQIIAGAAGDTLALDVVNFVHA